MVWTDWTFFSNHGHVLLSIARDPDIRTREIAAGVGITERTAQQIVGQLVEAGYLTRTREGRRNHYEIHPELPLRHPMERDTSVGAILSLLLGEGSAGSPQTQQPATDPTRQGNRRR
jgi:hypothetical protein